MYEIGLPGGFGMPPLALVERQFADPTDNGRSQLRVIAQSAADFLAEIEVKTTQTCQAGAVFADFGTQDKPLFA